MANTTGDLALIIPALTDTVQTTIGTHLGANFEDIDIAVSAKINTTQIANNLTENVAGKVLDATQGKIINDDLATHKADNVTQLALKANKSQGSYLSATTLNGWTGTLNYRRNDIGQLELSGTILVGTNTFGTIVLTLPVGFRPLTHTAIPAYNSSGGGSLLGLALQTTGDLILYNPLAGFLAGQSIRINAICV